MTSKKSNFFAVLNEEKKVLKKREKLLEKKLVSQAESSMVEVKAKSAGFSYLSELDANKKWSEMIEDDSDEDSNDYVGGVEPLADRVADGEEPGTESEDLEDDDEENDEEDEEEETNEKEEGGDRGSNSSELKLNEGMRVKSSCIPPERIFNGELKSDSLDTNDRAAIEKLASKKERRKKELNDLECLLKDMGFEPSLDVPDGKPERRSQLNAPNSEARKKPVKKGLGPSARKEKKDIQSTADEKSISQSQEGPKKQVSSVRERVMSLVGKQQPKKKKNDEIVNLAMAEAKKKSELKKAKVKKDKRMFDR